MDYKQALVEALSKTKIESRKQILVENRQVKKEDTEEFLEPRFDSRASFYKKAKVVKKDNGDEELYSYDTHVGGVRDGKPYSKGRFSPTTTRHQKDYFQQRGFDPKKVDIEESKKLTEEVSDEMYDIAETVACRIRERQVNSITKEELQELIDDAAEEIGVEYDEGNEDFDTTIRGILSYKGFETDYGTGELRVMEESKKVEGKKLTEDYYEDGIFSELEMAFEDAGLEYTRFSDAGVLTNNLGWIVDGENGRVELTCDGTYLSESKKVEEGNAELFKKKINKTDIKKQESKKLQETEDMLGRAYDYLDDIGISAADLLVKVSNFFGQDETNEFANTLLSEMNESKKKVEGKIISQHKKVGNK